ncbi:hypothetical protein L917_20373, partial [Phytophthora nicotianae]
LKMETIIPTQLLHPRWLLSSLKDTNSQIIVAQNLSTVTSIIPPPRSSWDVNREFREANCLVTAICESVSSLGMNEYRIAMKALNQKFEIFEELSSTLPATQSKRDELHEEGVTQCSTESCNTAATIVMTVDPPSAELSVETVDQSVEQSVDSRWRMWSSRWTVGGECGAVGGVGRKICGEVCGFCGAVSSTTQ